MSDELTITRETTLAELSLALHERDLNLQIHAAGPTWTVWLYPPDDPELLIQRHHTELWKAIAEAFECWDLTEERLEARREPS